MKPRGTSGKGCAPSGAVTTDSTTLWVLGNQLPVSVDGGLTIMTLQMAPSTLDSPRAFSSAFLPTRFASYQNQPLLGNPHTRASLFMLVLPYKGTRGSPVFPPLPLTHLLPISRVPFLNTLPHWNYGRPNCFPS
jgi:hypothetical protein